MSTHGKNPGFRSGDNWAVCDVCGVEYRTSKMKWRWDGALVCEEDWEQRHPQDYVRSKKDRIIPSSEVRTEPSDSFTEVSGATSPDVPPSGTFDNSL
jgi:hypothetical protein